MVYVRLTAERCMGIKGQGTRRCSRKNVLITCDKLCDNLRKRVLISYVLVLRKKKAPAKQQQFAHFVGMVSFSDVTPPDPKG